uniref:Gamma-2-syntrophin n=1 Tax=Lygus hesperus TaxID=30085 RepID=A0A0A9Z8F5_LYGHE
MSDNQPSAKKAKMSIAAESRGESVKMSIMEATPVELGIDPDQLSNDVLPVVGSLTGMTFPYTMIVMDMLYMFMKTNIEFFMVHGLARFVININEMTIRQHILHTRFIVCTFAIPFAVVCDSYLGYNQYYLLVAGLSTFILVPSLYFVMSAPTYMLPATQKHRMYHVCNIFHGVIFLLEPVRIVTVLKTVLRRYQFPSKRYFCFLLVLGWNVSSVLAACGIYVARSSRICYSILMIINIVNICIYVSFMLIFKPIFFPRADQNYCCVEKVFANTICYVFKRITQYCCKGKRRIFKTAGWRDFNSFHFSERTSMSAHAYVGVLLVMTPLTSYFVMKMVLDVYYVTQFPMLEYEEEQFPVGGLKAAFYCLLSPIFEYFILRHVKKLLKSETAIQLTLVGIGVFLVAIALFWCSVIQHKMSNRSDFMSYNTGTGHLVLVNAMSAAVSIRGKYYNEFMLWKVNSWFELLPWVPLKILRVPRSEIPFKITVSCKIFSMYDDYELKMEEDTYNWYLIFPQGPVQLPVGTFHTKREVALKPNLYSPAVVNILCRIPICAGFLIFQKNEHLSITQIIKSSQTMITLEVVGKYTIMFALVGNTSNSLTVEAEFVRLGVYLLVIHIEDNSNVSLNWGTDITPTTPIRTTITIIKTGNPRGMSRWYMYPTLIIHALGELLAQVSIMSWLYFATPVDLRVLCFIMPTILAWPAYAYFYYLTPLRFQTVTPIAIFSFGCGCCFFIVLYFFAAIYHTHRWYIGKNVPRSNDSSKNPERALSHAPERPKNA